MQDASRYSPPPYGIETKTNHHELGSTVPKKSTLIDQHIEKFPGNSHNQRLIHEDLPEKICGFCLLRFLYHVHFLRSKNRLTILIVSKIDVKSAYHRYLLASLLAAMSITKVDGSDLTILWMTFGGANGPFDWPYMITKPLADLGNDLLNSNWDETKIHSPHAENLAAPVLLTTSTAFGKALLLDAVVPFSSRGKWMTFSKIELFKGCKVCKTLNFIKHVILMF